MEKLVGGAHVGCVVDDGLVHHVELVVFDGEKKSLLIYNGRLSQTEQPENMDERRIKQGVFVKQKIWVLGMSVFKF